MWWLLLCSAGSLIAWWQIRLLGDVRHQLGAFYGWFACAFLFYLATLWLVGRGERAGSPLRTHRLSLGVIGLVALLARLTLLGTAPTLSDDIHRYRWDGRVQRAGLDPYAYPPNHPALAFLRDEQFASINFPQLRTVYPPLTELAFRLGVTLGDTLTSQKAVVVSAELLTMLGLLVVLWRRGRSLLWVAAYAWHPLVVLEIAGSGHNDALGVAALWLGIAGWETWRWRGAVAAWSAAFWSKFASMILVPWWWFRHARRGWLAAFVALAATPVLLHPSMVWAVVESLSAMTTRFESNSSMFLVLAQALGPAAGRVAAFGLIGAWILWWARRQPDVITYLLGAFAAAALLSPVLHPWYVVWLIPCFCFRRVPALIALSGTAVFAYAMWPGRLATGAWHLPLWARVAEYAPVALLGMMELRKIGTGSLFPSSGNRKRDPVPFSPGPRGPSRLRVGVIIPARNEEAAIGRVLAGVPREGVRDIIVVDNGSTDATAEAAAAAGARVVREPTPGYGRACLAGLAALSPDVDTVVFLDGDHADYPEELPRLLAPIAHGEADLVIGSRAALAEPGSLTPQQQLGNRLACTLMRLCFDVRATDLGPFRAIRRDALERLGMRDQAFGWTVEMQAKSARAGLRVVEVPVRYRPRFGRSKISGTLTGTIRAGVAILSTIAKIALERQAPSTPTRQLLVFLKDPQPGQVKTRMASDIGDEAAAAIYRACAELTLERLAPLRQEIRLCVDPPQAIARIRGWLGAGWTMTPQRGADLGERVARATHEAFADGAQRVAVIGTDSPWLTSDDIDAAFRELEAADVVVGPTDDGGYYLIGLARSAPALFDGIAWSSPEVFRRTCEKAKALGLRVAVLRQGYDLDHVEDVKRFMAESRRAHDA